MLTAAVLGVGISTSASLGADRYEIDPVHTSIGFAVRHFVINKVRGHFTNFSGTILYDEEDITKTSFSVTIKAASIDTRHFKRDKDLRSPDFLDVKKYPVITFQSTRIEKMGQGYVAIGTLTMHGVSKEIALPFTIPGKVKDPWGNTRIGVEAAITVNRQDYGISWSQRMDSGGLVVGNEVQIEINVEAIKN